MPDISMCLNKECPSRYTCFRFIARPSDYQYYSEFKVPGGKNRCDSYIEEE